MRGPGVSADVLMCDGAPIGGLPHAVIESGASSTLRSCAEVKRLWLVAADDISDVESQPCWPGHG